MILYQQHLVNNLFKMSCRSFIVKLMDDNEIYFRVSGSSPLAQIYNLVCVRHSFTLGSFALTYNGNILDPEFPCGTVPEGGVVRVNDFSK